jgi:hypothetical protein
MAKALVLAFGGMITALLTRFFGDEVKAWMPWFTKRLLRIAIERLPEGQGERFSEEWASHINEVPGELVKVVVALGCVSAAQEMASLLKYGEPVLNRVFKRSLDIAISALFLFLLAPVFLCVVVLVKIDCAGVSVLSREERVGANGGRFFMYRFRLGTLDTNVELPNGQFKKMKQLSPLGYLLWRTEIHELPQLINVLRGEMTLVGPHRLGDRYRGPLPPAGYTNPFAGKPWKYLVSILWDKLRTPSRGSRP